MKKIALICLLMASFSFQMQAQDNSDFKKETIEFIKITGAASAFENAISQIGTMVSEDKKLPNL